MLELSSLPPPLRAFHTLWDGKRGGRVVPARQDFAFEELAPWLGQLHLIEVLADDFRFKVFAGKSAVRLQQEVTGRLLSEFEPRWMAEDAARDYQRSVEARVPVFADRSRQERDGRLYSWRRLVLPLGPTEVIDHLFVCMEYDFI
jgi:hypothetical protein